MKNLSVSSKFLVIFAVLGAFVLISTIFVTSQLSRIAGSFQSVSQHETTAALNISRAASRLYAVRAALADLQLSTTPEGNQRAEAEYKASFTIFNEKLDTAVKAMPETASTLLAIKGASGDASQRYMPVCNQSWRGSHHGRGSSCFTDALFERMCGGVPPDHEHIFDLQR